MRLASTILALGLCSGCLTGGGIPLEYTAVLNSTLYLEGEISKLEASELEMTDLQRALIAIAATDLYVKERYPELAGSYLELVSQAAGQYAYPQEVEEILETVRLLTQE